MNEDIIKWAREVDPVTKLLIDKKLPQRMDHDVFMCFLARFAALVRADEREACAKVCQARYMGDNNREDMEARRCAAAIRERSQA
jgi:hypothetical protein